MEKVLILLIVCTGITIPVLAQYHGGMGRGDYQTASFIALESIYQGGIGRGDHALNYSGTLGGGIPTASSEFAFSGNSDSYSFTVYPNPTSGKIRFRFIDDKNIRPSIIKVFDLLGNVIQKIDLATTTILSSLDLGNVGKGMYVISLEKDGVETNKTRVVLQ